MHTQYYYYCYIILLHLSRISSASCDINFFHFLRPYNIILYHWHYRNLLSCLYIIHNISLFRIKMLKAAAVSPVRASNDCLFTYSRTIAAAGRLSRCKISLIITPGLLLSKGFACLTTTRVCACDHRIFR